jgi:hypothetical protein
MLIYSIRWPTLLTLVLFLQISACSTEAVESSMPHVLERAVVIDNLEKMEARGIAVHIEQLDVGGSMALVRVCKERSGLPDGVSGSLQVSLMEPAEDGRERLLASFSQQMRLIEDGHQHDFGRFQVRTERLNALSLILSNSYRDSGESWIGDDSAIRLPFKDIISDLQSEERTFSSSFDRFDCDLPSGIYNFSP